MSWVMAAKLKVRNMDVMIDFEWDVPGGRVSMDAFDGRSKSSGYATFQFRVAHAMREINEYISGGQKVGGYVLDTGDMKIKVRGVMRAHEEIDVHLEEEFEEILFSNGFTVERT